MTDSHPAMNSIRETRAWSTSGYLIFLAFLALLALTIYRIIAFAGSDPQDSEIFGFLVSTALSVVALIVLSSGFYMIQPNQAAAITLFGSYRGTDRSTGLRWVWPWMGKTKVSVRANNVVSEKLKINDLRGNPIEIAANIVWRVTDSAQALFDVDDYQHFVHIQIETALREVARHYAYDHDEDGAPTLRADAEAKAKLIQAAGKRKAPPQEACKLIGNFAQAETKMIKFVESHMQKCGIPAQVADQMKKGHANTTQLQQRVCSAAQQQQAGPAGPSLSEALGSASLPEAKPLKRGGSTFDTLNGNVLTR